MKRQIALAVAAALLAGTAVAETQLGWSVGAGAGYNDNATRVDTDKVSDTLTALSGTIAYEQKTQRIDASLTGFGTYLSYVDDTYDADFLGSLDGNLTLGIVPERFLWTFDDTFGQITIDRFAPVTPENRQNANYFSTGPDVYIRLGSATDLRLSGRFSDSRYEDTDTSNDQRLSGDISFIRRSSAQVAWSAVASASRVEYDLPGNPGYDLQSLYGSLEAEGARQTVNLDLGATRIADGGESQTNPLVRLEWNRRLNPSWTLDLNAGTEFRNTADRFVGGGTGPEGGTGGVTVSNVPSESYHGDLTLAFERQRTRAYVGSSYYQNNFIGSGELDEDGWGATAGISRQFTQRLQGFLDLGYWSRNFESDTGSDDTRTFSARLDWQAGRSIFVTAGYRYEQRDSDIYEAGTYTENFGYLSFSYRYGEAAAPRAFSF